MSPRGDIIKEFQHSPFRDGLRGAHIAPYFWRRVREILGQRSALGATLAAVGRRVNRRRLAQICVKPWPVNTSPHDRHISAALVPFPLPPVLCWKVSANKEISCAGVRVG